MSRLSQLQTAPPEPATRSQSTPPVLRRPRTPSNVLYDRQKAMIVSLQKVQKQWERQRTELLAQWSEARILWEDERSFLIDERNAVMIEYKNVAVDKAKLQKEMATLMEEYSKMEELFSAPVSSSAAT